MIVSSSPGRAGIVGNPTDMYGGCVVSTSLHERATVTVRPAERLLLDSSGTKGIVSDRGDLAQTGDYLDVVKAVLSHFWDDLPHHRFELACRTDIPARSGLAGSTALCVALTGAVLRLIGREMEAHFIAEECRIIERVGMNVQCGFQDQCMAVFGGRNFIDTRGKENLLGQAAGEPLATVEPLEDRSPDPPFLLASTGIERESSGVHTPIRERWEKGDPAVVSGYRRVTELGWMGKKAILLSNWDALGTYMNENHDIQRDLGGSHPACDRLINAAREAGAHGAKLAGAGAGGTIIALCRDIDQTEAALREAGAFRVLHPRPGPGLTVEGGLGDGC